MGAMLAIGIALSGLFISKLKRVRAGENSMVAIYVADSAMEKCLYEARHPGSPQALVLPSGATFSIMGGALLDTDVTADCSPLAGETYRFRATGTYRGVSRALEISQ
jgi:hypothetical protein